MNGKQQHKITGYKILAYVREITEKWTGRHETVTTNGLIPYRITFMKMTLTTMNSLLLQKLVTLRTETILQRK